MLLLLINAVVMQCAGRLFYRVVWRSENSYVAFDEFIKRVFPGSLLQFYTNKNSEAIFGNLQTVDLARTDYSKNWQRNFEDYPVGGTNLWPQGKSVNPLRMRLY
jgi:hypothetical protein